VRDNQEMAGGAAPRPGRSRIRAPGDPDDPRAELTVRSTRPAAFLDRDGTLNVDTGFVYRPEDLIWTKDAPAAVRLLNRAGYYVFVVTNQSGVARGLYPESAIDLLHAHMQNELLAQGAHVDAFYYCPHHPEGTVAAFALQCRCRKPGPGMLEQAAADWPIDRARSVLIGDGERDMAAAAAFGIRGLRFDAATCSLPELLARELALRAPNAGARAI
jgi:D-glycero-D-manno-heptose 1,7-bisphosphate phosphatase